MPEKKSKSPASAGPGRATLAAAPGAAWRRLADRLAGWAIRLAGLSVILILLAMLALMGLEALPLFRPARHTAMGAAEIETANRNQEINPQIRRAFAAMAVDADLALARPGALLLRRDGRYGFVESGASRPDFPSEAVLEEAADPEGRERTITHVEPHAGNRFSLLWDDGTLSLVRARFDFPADAPASGRFETLAVDAAADFLETLRVDGPPRMGLIRGSAETYAALRIYDGGVIRETRLKPGRGLAARRQAAAAARRTVPPHRYEVISAALAESGEKLYLGTQSGAILSVALPGDMDSPAVVDAVPATRDGAAVTALAFLQGDYAIAAGDAGGGAGIWFPRREDGALRLRRSHYWPGGRAGAAVSTLLPSRRSRSTTAVAADGGARWLASTTGAELMSMRLAPGAATAVNVRGDVFACLDGAGALVFHRVDNPHPPAGFRGFFGKLLYEGYERPDYVWQSTGGADSEPKLSLTPLLWGTAKAALFALMFAAPLSLLSAMYISQLVSPEWRARIKPAVEMAAAAPSVVIGFAAALWLAPVLERNLLFPPLFALALAAFGAAWLLIRRRFANSRRLMRIEGRNAFLFLLPALVLAGLAAWAAQGWLAEAFFDGNFRDWLSAAAAAPGRDWLHYDQRNAVVIAVAMGLAVCPMIFSLAEDAMTAVPPSLAAASLALGATKWQTVWRVVAPSASPGLFTAVMLGFGRAVGETMIVLMAAGNTPLMSLSPFTGMRTLSANIAVEMPEAPVGETLYLTLFLCALLLFILTFLINGAAEAVRRRLRKAYGSY